MDVLQAHRSLRRVSDVGHHVERLDGVTGDHVREGGLGTGKGVVEGADPAAFVDGQTPAVCMDVGFSTAAFETSAMERIGFGRRSYGLS